ncbi:MAG: chromosome segregation protein SMC, partial [Dokdonella sp.]
HAALGEDAGIAKQWLEQHGLSGSRRLGEALEVADGWEVAVETVLQGWLDAVLVENPARSGLSLGSLLEVDLTLLEARMEPVFAPGDEQQTLASHVRGPDAARDLLRRVRVAPSAAEARAMVAVIGSGDSVITPAGEWFGHGFVRVARAQGSQVGVLAREREIVALTSRVEILEGEIETHACELDACKHDRTEAERSRDEAQREVYTANRKLAEIAGQLQSQRGRLDNASERLRRVDLELGELLAKLDLDREQSREARGRLDVAVERMGDLEQQRQQLDAERRRLLESREEARMNLREVRDAEHQAALSIESKRAALVSLEQAMQRMHAQRDQLDARRSELAAQIALGGDPLAALEGERQTCLHQRLLVDRELVEARKRLEECDSDLRAHEVRRNAIVEALVEQRQKLADLRLGEQEQRLRAQALAQAIVEAGFEIDALFAELPADIDMDVWQSVLLDIEQKIRRLEPVNLAAIQEYEEQSQRKTYLDAQLNDLTTALETLENAIRKIDRETRQRFKETFDRVNAGVQELFPRLFGGGQAYLELTGD